MPHVTAIDHLVLTVTELDATITFYREALGMHPEAFEPEDGTKRWALKLGVQKINLHVAGAEFEPKSRVPTPGAGDLCFLSDTPLTDWQAHLAALGIAIEDGPVHRTGATGPITSLYLRDPDGNLIEIANQA